MNVTQWGEKKECVLSCLQYDSVLDVRVLVCVFAHMCVCVCVSFPAFVCASVPVLVSCCLCAMTGDKQLFFSLSFYCVCMSVRWHMPFCVQLCFQSHVH